MTTLVQQIMESRTGFPKDRCINTWHFVADELSGGQQIAVRDAIDGFWNDLASGQTADLASRISEVIDRTVDVKLRFFNTTVAGVGPYAEHTFTLDASTGDAPMPSEVACCLSYRKNGATGLQARRQRGRIFIGPLNTGAIDVTASGQAIVDSGFTNDIVQAAIGLYTATTVADPDLMWVVHSTFGSSIVPGSSPPRMVNPPDVQTDYEIDHIFVDDAFDTQRRRGEAAVTRRSADLP